MLVTIVTPSYNQGGYIEDTIQSVINQTYNDIEYIILDACSSDNTRNILEKYKDHPRVSRIIIEKDKGQADAIDKGFRLGRGDIMGWINSDDKLHERIVERSVQAFRTNPKLGMTFGDIEYFDDHNNILWTKKSIAGFNFEYLLNKWFYVNQQGSFYSRQALEEIGFLDTSLHYCMDLDLWLKILSKYEAAYLACIAASFRRHDACKTVTGDFKFLLEINRTLARHGAGFLSPNKRRVYWRIMKVLVKKILPHEYRSRSKFIYLWRDRTTDC
ncbi:MAG: glycosyltransferase family 2 protein [Thermodesulfobacteriota bacterium]|nr:glycosyltransferase family 2 protein [Thermodesulfobacteriota bacterium]